MISGKRKLGQYFTRGNPFDNPGFTAWAGAIDWPHVTVLEPFAGENALIEKIQALGYGTHYQSYDINPRQRSIIQQDTLADFPKNYSVCVTNPPWLAKNFVTKMKLPDYNSPYDNLYKHCLEKMLTHCDYVAAVLPASFARTGLFFDRLHYYVLLHANEMFSDTTHPVCLALFGPKISADFTVYYDDQLVGSYQKLSRALPAANNPLPMQFNCPDGNLGFIAFDNTRERSIRFCSAAEVETYTIKASSRFITKIQLPRKITARRIAKLNQSLETFRDSSHDFFLTPFKGLRRDGLYRRRMDFALAKRLLSQALRQASN